MAVRTPLRRYGVTVLISVSLHAAVLFGIWRFSHHHKDGAPAEHPVPMRVVFVSPSTPPEVSSTPVERPLRLRAPAALIDKVKSHSVPDELDAGTASGNGSGSPAADLGPRQSLDLFSPSAIQDAAQ